jgi:hypothetical protein
VGEAFFGKVNTTYDDFEGNKKYVMNVWYPNKTDEDTMTAMFDKYLKDVKALPENEGKKWRSLEDPRVGYRIDEKSGKKLFTFKTNAFRTVDGVETQNTLPVFDIYGKPYPKTTAIGNGSKIQVRFDPAWYYKSKDGNGLSMLMTGIMVHELVEFGGGNNAGFEFKKFDLAADGAKNNTIPEEEIPF